MKCYISRHLNLTIWRSVESKTKPFDARRMGGCLEEQKRARSSELIELACTRARGNLAEITRRVRIRDRRGGLLNEREGSFAGRPAGS